MIKSSDLSLTRAESSSGSVTSEKKPSISIKNAACSNEEIATTASQTQSLSEKQAKHSLFDIKPNNGYFPFLCPSEDRLSNFFLGFEAYQSLGLSEYLASPAVFFQQFTPNSTLANLLFPTQMQSDLPSSMLTEATRYEFAQNPLLRLTHREVLNLSLNAFGLKVDPNNDKKIVVNAHILQNKPAWLQTDGHEERKLLAQMIKSLHLLGNKKIASNLAKVVVALLQKMELSAIEPFTPFLRPKTAALHSLKKDTAIDELPRQSEARQASKHESSAQGAKPIETMSSFYFSYSIEELYACIDMSLKREKRRLTIIEGHVKRAKKLREKAEKAAQVALIEKYSLEMAQFEGEIQEHRIEVEMERLDRAELGFVLEKKEAQQELNAQELEFTLAKYRRNIKCFSARRANLEELVADEKQSLEELLELLAIVKNESSLKKLTVEKVKLEKYIGLHTKKIDYYTYCIQRSEFMEKKVLNALKAKDVVRSEK